MYTNPNTTGGSYEKKHVVTTRDDLNAYGDIAAEQIPIRIALNKPGATDEFIWKKVMQYYDMSYEDIKDWGGNEFGIENNYVVQTVACITKVSGWLLNLE